MKTNKMLPDSSISKVWENFRKMNGIILTFVSTNWVAQSNGTFTNTVEYEGFTSDEILEVDLYDDGTLTETQITEYDGYITEFNVEDGKIVAVATTKPTQSIKILARGEIVGKMIVNGEGSSNINASNVSCLDKDGNESTVQTEMDELNNNFANLIGFPDYANGTVIDNNYTAAENGFILTYAATTATSTSDTSYSVKVNDVTILAESIGISANKWWNRYLGLIPIKKGDIVTYTVNANTKVTITFFPCRY